MTDHVDQSDRELDLCPHYSSKIQEAWEVVRRMQSLGYDLTLESRGSREWFAVFRPSVLAANEASPRSSGNYAETAICLAAVKVLSASGDIEIT